MQESNFPEKIQSRIRGFRVTENTVGCSGAHIYQIGDDMFLKPDAAGSKIKREADIMRWLHGKLPVPQVVETCEDENGIFYLLTTKITGEMACSDANKNSPEETVRLLAEGIKMFHAIPIADCPYINDTDAMLRQARYNLENGLLEKEDWTWELTANLGLNSTEEVIDYLDKNRPQEELVLSHGDFCLPNVFFKNGQISGFIDLGDCGISDIWHDIMMCAWSIGYNLKTDEYTHILYETLSIQPNAEKLRYYEILSTLL